MNPIKTKASVVEVVKYDEKTYLVKFECEKRVPRFHPGQFLHLTIDDFDPAGGFWPESRVFSIASSYGDPTIDIIYSVKGDYTGRMQETLVRGTQVWLKFPYGNFIIEDTSGADTIVLVAGGTGISPFIPYLKLLSKGHNPSCKVLLFYGVKTNSVAIFKELLHSLVAKGLLYLDFSCQNEEPIPFADSNNHMGVLNIDSISLSVKKRTPVFYISGPPVMIQAFKTKLLNKNVPIDLIKIDEWE